MVYYTKEKTEDDVETMKENEWRKKARRNPATFCWRHFIFEPREALLTVKSGTIIFEYYDYCIVPLRDFYPSL